jgi:L-fuculose-phosphate aldolase
MDEAGTPGAGGQIDAARQRLADAGRRLAAQGLVIGTGGNLSERVGDQVAISATGVVLEAMEPADVSVVDLTGRPAAGEPAPSSEIVLHLGIYERFGAGAVVHTHAPVASALSCVLDEVPCVHYQMILLGGAIRVAPYRTFGTPELAEATLDALEGKSAALMANHGAIVHAPALDQAVEHSLLLEWACTVYWRAAAIGTPRLLDDAGQREVIEAAVARNYGASSPGAP